MIGIIAGGPRPRRGTAKSDAAPFGAPGPVTPYRSREAVSRRRVLSALALAATPPPQVHDGTRSLALAPIELGGDWGGSLPRSALAVVERMRAVSLAGVPLVSGRQPERVRVDNHLTGPPHIWLHFDRDPVAEIGVDVGARDWSKLAYQFGHELGHVLANSWGPDAAPRPGCQWLEEALVETFSLRGLALLGTSWESDPPFPGDQAFGAAIRRYRDNQLWVYAGYAAAGRVAEDPRAWFRERRGELERSNGLSEACEALVPWLLGEMTGDIARAGELGALNLWPKRSALPLGSYLNVWERRCQAMGLAGWLPRRVREMVLGG